LREIDTIIVHCSATPEGRDIGAEEIRSWHMARGWRDIGYHYVVCLDGRIELGRELGDIGSHAKGHNAKSIGVCYVGGIGEDGEYDDTRTQEQRESLEILLATLVRIFPGAEIIGHRDVANRACPCFDAKEEYKWL
jgi:N-acetylmuramoyl-L-alanine amidase